LELAVFPELLEVKVSSIFLLGLVIGMWLDVERPESVLMLEREVIDYQICCRAFVLDYDDMLVRF
jgi:hypothetical protein